MHVPLQCHFTRRTFVRLMAAAGLVTRTHPVPTAAQPSTPAWSYPMGLPGRPMGDGLLVRHGYATENTWYNPGWLYPEMTAGHRRRGASSRASAACGP